MTKKPKYDVESITTLPPIEAIRARPHMYIGKTDSDGLHHLIKEIVDNSIDEALGGYCNTISLHLLSGDEEGVVEITDNGRGIPCGINSKGVEVLEEMFTTTHSGGKFDNEAYEVSGGLHGVGTTIVNALSDFCYITSKRDGIEMQLKFEDAKGQGLKEVGKTKETGTVVKFKPSMKWFDECSFDYSRIKDYLTEKAYLNPMVTFILHDKRTNDYDEIKKNGLGDLLDDMTVGLKPLSEMCTVESKLNDTTLSLHLRFLNSSETLIRTFANSIPTVQGGSHLDAANKALCEVLNAIGIKMGIINKNEPLKVPDIKDGLSMIVSVKYPKIAYESQTKDKLSVSAVYKDVMSILSDDPMKAFKKLGNESSLEKMNTLASELCRLDNLKDIIKRFIEIRARKEHIKSSKAVIGNNRTNRLNPNIRDGSSKNPWEKEVFIVEGDSAGGTAGSARNLVTQAIVKLRGKIINVSKANIKDVYVSASLVNIINAIGTGCGPDFDISKLRYHKIILLTDADVDGAHIRALIINFFFRFMPKLLEGGYVYIAEPPLYGIKDTRSGKMYYAFSRAEMNEIIKEHFGDRNYTITRFKGLGEMNADQLKATAMNPATRKLIQLIVDPDMTEEEMTLKMDRIFEKDVDFRKEMISDVVEERREIARQFNEQQ